MIRISACAVGRPTLIDEDDCDVRLPCNEAIWNYDHPYSKSLIDEYYNEVHVKKDTRMTLTNNGLCACFISVIALLGRVSQFVNRSKPSNSLPPWDSQSQFAILTDEIDMWYNSLSPHYTYTKERLRKLMTNGTGAIFASLHLLYYGTIVILYKSVLSQGNGKVESREFIRASAERCSAEAKVVVSICTDILQHGFHYLCLFTLYPIFVTSTVLVNDLYSSDSTVVEEAKKNLETCEEYLSAIDPHWGMGGKLLRMIREMRKNREEQEKSKAFNSSERGNFEQSGGEMFMGTDSGLLAYWNRTTNVVDDNNLDNITSIILPEQLLAPRWLDSFNDSPFGNCTLSSLLRSPDPFSPRTLSRLLKKDKDTNGENSTEDDYFSQDMTNYNSFPPPVFNGYPMMDLSAINQHAYDWTAGRMSPLNRPFKHWSTINGNNITSNSMTEESSTSDTRSSSSTSTTTNN